MAKAKTDPLLAALIAKLPKAGEEWPVDNQIAWLRMMAMAFGSVYGGDAASRMVAPGLIKEPGLPVYPPFKLVPPKYQFYIDEQGVARKANGKPITAKEVSGTLYDLRGIDGDVKTIQWADGSTGLNGADLTISAV